MPRSKAAHSERTSKVKKANPAASNGGIGLQNERSLHAALKKWYAKPGDEIEVKVDGYIVDIVRGGLLIEIQTRNLSAIGRKLRVLAPNHPVRLVYPIPRDKWIVRTDKKGERILTRRKSPRHGDLLDLFDELVAIPDLIEHPNFECEVLLIEEEEVRCEATGRRWWRRGHSVRDRKLLAVIESVRFSGRADFQRFMPADLAQPFTNREFAKASGVPIYRARRITYCLRKIGLIELQGKRGKQLLYARTCD